MMSTHRPSAHHRGRNPFRPGDPVPDPYVGRVALRTTFAEDLVYRLEDAGAAPPLVVLGLTGTGKSASLNSFRDIVEEFGWVAPLRQKAERDMGLRTLMGRALADVEMTLGRMDISDAARRALGQLAEVRVELGFVAGTVTTSKRAGPDDASLGQTLYGLLERLADAADDTHVCMMLDELHLLRPASLRALSFAIEQAMNSRLPIAFVMTGLPHLRRLLMDAGMYTLRFTYREIGNFTEAETILALRETARTVPSQDVTDEAARLCHQLTGGYPHFVQTYGYIAWNIGRDMPISLADMQRTHEIAWADLCASFFRPRWVDVPGGQQDVLLALARLGDEGHALGAVAAALGKRPEDIARTMARLVDRGDVVQAKERGPYQIALPKLGEYLRTEVLAE
jgi:hypothetical protein